LSQAAPPDSSGAGILFFCADAIGIPPRQKSAIVKSHTIPVRGKKYENSRVFFMIVSLFILFILFTSEQILPIK